MPEIKGKISQIIGPVVDVHFDIDNSKATSILPNIHDALKLTRPGGGTLIIEVQQHIGEDTVRCVAMDSTDGLKRGLEVIPTGGAISMPVGSQIRGRVMNVTGDSIDGLGTLDNSDSLPIHREPPKFEDLTTSQEVLYTGIKVIDLLEPYLKGGRSACSVALAWARPCSSKSLSTILQRNITDSRSSPEWASVPARATTCCAR